MADNKSMETVHFRILFWQKVAPLVVLPVFGLLFIVSPVTEGWSPTAWYVAGGVVAGAIALYLGMAWRVSSIQLDDVGLTLRGASGRETWPYEKLLKVKQIGAFRVRMCFDPDIPDQHMHITFDLVNSDRFVDTLLDRYAEKMGHELPSLESQDAAA
jgi:hypothetical protein